MRSRATLWWKRVVCVGERGERGIIVSTLARCSISATERVSVQQPEARRAPFVGTGETGKKGGFERQRWRVHTSVCAGGREGFNPQDMAGRAGL